MSNAADGYLGDRLPHEAKCGCTDCQLEKTQAALHTAQERIKVLEGALKYRRFGDTATLFERCVDMLEGRDRELELLKGEKWTSLYLNHFRNAIAVMRAALKEPPCS